MPDQVSASSERMKLIEDSELCQISHGMIDLLQPQMQLSHLVVCTGHILLKEDSRRIVRMADAASRLVLRY